MQSNPSLLNRSSVNFITGLCIIPQLFCSLYLYHTHHGSKWQKVAVNLLLIASEIFSSVILFRRYVAKHKLDVVFLFVQNCLLILGDCFNLAKLLCPTITESRINPFVDEFNKQFSHFKPIYGGLALFFSLRKSRGTELMRIPSALEAECARKVGR